ncbi:DUF4180 domain-containing protein [Nitrospirillum viridazoti]|uniref:Uncharacterized protein DUF4180 n=1 Tax=Nitrospirillum amazonense TaxID=28077 RepID=A0A560J393_9PROT|nr:DUF4180 domain-containing protein [Nitrospirillum amazonense]TWB63704.1 uncharacterized protein DUF4180 [Nitrospirillum amazonense]
MTDLPQDIQGTRVLVCAAQGPLLTGDQDAVPLIGLAWEHGARVVAIPLGRLAPGFLTLATGQAGAIIQKFANYQLRPVIVGDVSAWTADSGALRDFIYEANRGQVVWFVDDLAALERRLAP